MSGDARTPVPTRILRRAQETDDVFTLDLDVSSRPEGFAFAPGQFNMLWLFGVGEVPISISGDPADPERLVHTIRAVGPVTRALATLGKGDTVGLRGPYGSAWPLAACAGKDVVVVAGGLGLAPLRPAIEALAADAGRGGRLFVLVGARTPAEMLFLKDLSRWRRGKGTTVHLTVDRADQEWRGSVGVVTALLDRVELEPSRTVALVCGPEIMMRFAARALQKKGLPETAIWLSLERNMKCGVGLCGHCQLGPHFLCKEGPVLPLDRLAWLIDRREV